MYKFSFSKLKQSQLAIRSKGNYKVDKDSEEIYQRFILDSLSMLNN